MAGYAPEDSSNSRMEIHSQLNSSSLEELHDFGTRWYFSRKEIEEYSPSRRDGIDLKKETYLRKSYCTFLQDLGMKLKVPQVTIATAILFCHRFFLRQSHSKSDRMTIATVCMFLAGKVEETPRPLKDVILISYEIIHKKDPVTVQRIKQKEVYEKQKELILFGERLVLTTLGFDLNVVHPYKPLVEAIKKFKVAQNSLAQVAWNFVNDGLRTSLFLQFKPHQIAAGAIFLAAKFLKVKLPSDGDKVWWQEFDVTPRQLEDVSNQMLELYEQNRTAQLSHGNESESSVGAGTVNPPANVREGYHNRPFATQQANVDGNDEAGSVSHLRGTAGAGGVIVDKADAAETLTKIDKDSVKAGIEKRRKLGNVAAVQNTIVDENSLIERELENGVEFGVDDNKMRQTGRERWPKPLHRIEQPPPSQERSKPKSFRSENGKFNDRGHDRNAEEGELSSVDEHDLPFPKSQGSIGKVSGVKRRQEEKGWSDFSERDLKRIR